MFLADGGIVCPPPVAFELGRFGSTISRRYARWSGRSFPADARTIRYDATQHTREGIVCTSRSGGLAARGEGVNSSWICSCRRSMRLSGRSSRISINAPDRILVTSFPARPTRSQSVRPFDRCSRQLLLRDYWGGYRRHHCS